MGRRSIRPTTDTWRLDHWNGAQANERNICWRHSPHICSVADYWYPDENHVLTTHYTTMTNPELFTLQLFKIQAKNGKFSTGGVNVSWTKKGKTWSEHSHVVAHLNLLSNQSRLSYLTQEARVVKYELAAAGSTSVKSMLADVDVKNREQGIAEAARQQELYRQQRFEEFERLRQEFQPDTTVI